MFVKNAEKDMRTKPMMGSLGHGLALVVKERNSGEYFSAGPVVELEFGGYTGTEIVKIHTTELEKRTSWLAPMSAQREAGGARGGRPKSIVNIAG